MNIRIDTVATRWLDVLAAMVLGYREAWRRRRSVTVTRDGERILIRRDDGGRDLVIADLAPGSAATPELVRNLRAGLVVLELPPGLVATRRIAVPAQAREFLSGVVQNQIERLSPWALAEVAYGFEATAKPEEPGILDVRVSMASRTALEAARRELEAAGLSVDRIVAREAGAAPASAVTLWSRLAGRADETSRRARLAIGGGLAACAALSAAVGIWAWMSASDLAAESDDIAARTATLQRRLQGPASAQSLASLSPPERAWALKQTTPSAVVLIEALARALPDTAYVTELHLDGATMRVVGAASDPPALIAPLETSHVFTDVHFFAPTTRGRDGNAFQFHIESRIDPRAKLSQE